ncbi:MAG: hypothetical protein ETSY2_42140 [Candidatus Entotheonella gemina]|uniref:Uncharacterized protein n=1 Tax=Candidatus Entotheonella gemina TaxID=1429439 RepID=W4LN79_9BACT|nr:MAG: hypothetical protein ETSY2_42140 [Candidatus Entotheonella gemina]
MILAPFLPFAVLSKKMWHGHDLAISIKSRL